MSLNTFHIAIQGFGFRLNAIALAVQGLIDALQEEVPQTYYGSGKKSYEDVDLRQKVLEKYDAIEKARQTDKSRPIEPKPVDPLEKEVAKARREKVIAEVRARALANAKAVAQAEAATKLAIERASRPAIDMPFAAAAKAATDQRNEDDQIMALMAMMLLED